MTRILILLGAVAVAAFGFAAAVNVAGAEPPNQGNSELVLTVPSGYRCGGAVVPGDKLGDNAGLGPTISVSASAPIVQVTIKSGSKAELVSAVWGAGYLSATITITQDVSNYVVWTCSGGETTGTTTTQTTTTTETTTTETTTTATTTTEPTTTTETTETTTPVTTTSETPSAPLTPPLVPQPAAAQAAKPQPPAATVQPAGAEHAAPPATLTPPPRLAYTP